MIEERHLYASGEIKDIDVAIVALLERRRALTADLPHEGLGHSLFPPSFEVAAVVELYCRGLGAPGELVARAILNVSRVVGSMAGPKESCG